MCICGNKEMKKQTFKVFVREASVVYWDNLGIGSFSHMNSCVFVFFCFLSFRKYCFSLLSISWSKLQSLTLAMNNTIWFLLLAHYAVKTLA